MNSLDRPSDTVLEGIPQRALTFLRAIGTSVPIRSVLASHGYGEEDHGQGWRMLEQASGHSPIAPALVNDKAVMDAIATLDGWDEKGLRMIGAALRRLHPAQHEYVVADLAASRGAAAVLIVSRLLGRIEALRGAPEREATRTEDLAALATLAKRGFDDAEWTRLAALVQVAQRPEIVSVTTDGAAEERSREALLALHAWYTDWSETARALITRRDHLIRLGLARRKTRKATEDSAAELETTTDEDDGES